MVRVELKYADADELSRVHLFGLNFVNNRSVSAVAEALLRPRDSKLSSDDEGDFSSGDSVANEDSSALDRAVLPAVLTPNVDILVHLHRHAESVEADMFRRAQYCLPDGQPIVTASRLFGPSLAARLPGSGLFEVLWPRLAATKTPVVVIASSDEIAKRLEAEHSTAAVFVAPMFSEGDSDAINKIVDQILVGVVETGAERVLVGIGNPKDAQIIARLFERWPEAHALPLSMGLGGSFAMYLGLKKRAPEWVQRVGMEWLFRFAQEPRRLFSRYFVRGSVFFSVLWSEWRGAKQDPTAIKR